MAGEVMHAGGMVDRCKSTGWKREEWAVVDLGSLQQDLELSRSVCALSIVLVS